MRAKFNIFQAWILLQGLELDQICEEREYVLFVIHNENFPATKKVQLTAHFGAGFSGIGKRSF